MNRFFSLCAVALMVCLGISQTKAQVVQAGDAVVTCEATAASGFVIGLVHVQNANVQPVNTNWAAPMYHDPTWTLQHMGQVFGIALDGAGNIYTTATTCYGSTTFGPAGAGGIYKINAVTGAVTNWVTTVVSPSLNTVGTSQIPNTGPGLGNICFDPDHNQGQFFVTNMEDGKIYRINMSGIVQQIFDPMGPDGGTAGFAPRGERLWGIGYWNNRVYFSVWREDCGFPSAIVSNEIRSVPLSGAGAIVGPDVFEFSLPPIIGATNSNPVSDIEFTVTTGVTNTRMLLAERTMLADATPNAHASRLLEYVRTGLTWTASTSIFSIGTLASSACGYQANPIANSAGGCDYGYVSFDKNKHQTIGCDSAVWNTGDALHLGNPDIIYGLQRLPSTGGSIANSQLIDLDGNLATSQKTQIGDIDIVKTCVVKSICSQVGYTLTYDQSQAPKCCWDLTVTNNYQANFWTNIRLDILTAGVTFSSANAPAGWGLSSIGPTFAVFNPSVGQIPLGNSGPLKFCLNVGVAPPQKLLLTWIAKDGTICTDTLTTNCEQDTRKCGKLTNVNLKCNQTTPAGNTYSFSFTIFNDPTNIFTMSKASITVTSPVGVTLSPHLFSFPGVPPGGTSTTQNSTIFGGHPGDSLCLSIEAHNADSTWCCRFDTCFVLPPCKSCCDPLRVTFGQFGIGTNFLGTVTMNTTVTATIPLRSFNATVVSATRTSNCNVSPVGNVAGVFTGGSFTPVPVIPGPFGLNTSTISWGTNIAGSNATGAPLSLTLKFPPPPSGWFCRDTLRWCIKYTYQDTACHTCDTTICYSRVRYGLPWIVVDNPKDIPVPFHTDGGNGGGNGGTKGDGREPQGGTAQSVFTISMATSTTGQLTINNPSLQEGVDPGALITILGFDIEPEVGVDLQNISDNTTGQAARATDRIASLATLQQQINPGETRTFTLAYDNSLNALTFANYITVYYTVASDPETIQQSTLIAYARTPDGQGGDVLGVDKGIQLTNVRTYGLQFSNGNANGDGICRVVVTVTSDGDDLVAVGPGVDHTKMNLKSYRTLDPAAPPILLAEAPPATQAVESVVAAGEVVTPIYITVCGGLDKSATFHYTTYNQNGEVVTDGDVTASSPLAAGQAGINDPAKPGTRVNLVEAFPNPTTGSEMFRFTLAENDPNVSLVITNEQGQVVATLLKAVAYPAGTHEMTADLAKLPNGTYFYTLRTSTFTQTRKMQIVR
ncbi:MAG: T9SS type A sorting domain-containing protein [Bacteroidetes bacterium]|nr:T9SS type A sorting domain-containing protein [Bacteroidota bacterium]